MLEELYVENLGIIAEARIEPGPGLVAVTGETGTGKTLLLGAIRLLKGDNARTDRIGPHGPETRVEGRFVINDEETIVARRVGSRSRAYLDGAMVPAKSLTETIDGLVEIVEQHEHVSIGREASLRAMVDASLDADGDEALGVYRSAWERLESLRRARDEIGGDEMALARELDLAKHQLSEITAAALAPGEDAELKDRLSRMRHAGEITAALAEASHTIDDEAGAADGLRRALATLRGARDVDPTLGPLVEHLESIVVEVDEMALEIREAADGIEHDPGTLAAVEERAAVIADLKRKYGRTSDEVIAYAELVEGRVATLEEWTARAASIGREIEEAVAATVASGERLLDARRRAAKDLGEAAGMLLRSLGFGDPLLSCEVSSAPPGPHGADRLRLLFASDSSLTPGPASRVASGGELSRLVLAMRVAAGVADADVVAFDEIDAGVGGSTALEMGHLLAKLAVGRQVLVVTHLPQVAAYADTHFVVDRDGPSATVRRVEGPDRLTELARMLGGLEESERGQGHAAELLDVVAARKQE